MEPYDGGKVLAIWKETSSESSFESDDSDDNDDEVPKKPKGYYKIKVPIKKIFSTILVEEELIPE